jgi:hypothetical protein
LSDAEPSQAASATSPLVRLKPFIPAVLYMALIAWFSAQPGHGLDLGHIPLRDKGVHFVEFAVLGALFGSALWRDAQRRQAARSVSPRSHARALMRSALLAIALTSTWGYLDELHQAFVPGRTSDRWDLLADVLGAIAGSGVYFGAQWLKSTARRSR